MRSVENLQEGQHIESRRTAKLPFLFFLQSKFIFYVPGEANVPLAPPIGAQINKYIFKTILKKLLTCIQKINNKINTCLNL